MWIRASRHRLLSADPAQLESLQLKPITHSDTFGLFLKGREEHLVVLGDDLEAAEAVFDAVCQGLAAGTPLLDLTDRI